MLPGECPGVKMHLNSYWPNQIISPSLINLLGIGEGLQENPYNSAVSGIRSKKNISSACTSGSKP